MAYSQDAQGSTLVSDIAPNDIIALKADAYRVNAAYAVQDAHGDARLLYLTHQGEGYLTHRTFPTTDRVERVAVASVAVASVAVASVAVASVAVTTASEPTAPDVTIDPRRVLRDLVEAIHNGEDSGYGLCRYCQAEDYPVDKQGTPIGEGDIEQADEWHTDHYDWCPSVLAGAALHKID